METRRKLEWWKRIHEPWIGRLRRPDRLDQASWLACFAPEQGAETCAIEGEWSIDGIEKKEQKVGEGEGESKDVVRVAPGPTREGEQQSSKLTCGDEPSSNHPQLHCHQRITPSPTSACRDFDAPASVR